MAVVPTNYVIKVYSNETDAIAGGEGASAMAVTGGSAGNENMISQAAQEAATTSKSFFTSSK